jgi:hypothetical protein
MTDEHVISQNGWARQIARAIMRAIESDDRTLSTALLSSNE